MNGPEGQASRPCASVHELPRGSVIVGPSEDAVANFQERVVGVMRLQATTFEEVEHDASATSQAAIVVLVATIVPLLIWYDLGVRILVGTIVAALFGWLLSSLVLFLIGTRL